MATEPTHDLKGWLEDVPLVTLAESLAPLVGIPLPTLGYLSTPTAMWSAVDVDDICSAAVRRVSVSLKRGRPLGITSDQGAAVAAFDVKLPTHFPLCVALSAAFASDPQRTTRLVPWIKYCALLYSGMQGLELIDTSRYFDGFHDGFVSLQRDIAVSHEYAATVIPRKYCCAQETTLWNPTSVSFVAEGGEGCEQNSLLDSVPAGFAWLEKVAEQKPVIVRCKLKIAKSTADELLRCTTPLWGRGPFDEHILIPPVRIRVTGVIHRTIHVHDCRDTRICSTHSHRFYGDYHAPREGIVIRAEVLPWMFRYDIGRSPPTPTFCTSNFKRHFNRTEVPTLQYALLGALHAILDKYCEARNISLAISLDFFLRLQQGAFANADDLLFNVPAACERLWTSKELLSPAHPVELCSILNAVLRDDRDDQVMHAAVLVRGINCLCVVRTQSVPVAFPPNGVTYRGGAFDDTFIPFFSVGKVYRVPGFVASSFDANTCDYFLYRAAIMNNKPAIMWTIHVDPRGETEFRYKCKQANLVLRRAPGVGEEKEYLFAPYSAFQVLDVQWSATPDDRTPHRITIEAFVDNRDADENVPLAPWY
jgi:hypothetical protein